MNTTRTAALAAIKALKVGANSITIETPAARFVVVKRGRARYNLGELGGDWLTTGTPDEIVARAFDGKRKG